MTVNQKTDIERITVVLATDCGSTTSKARLFRKVGNEYRYIASGEAPTTVEAPYEDVTFGIRNAIIELEELTGHKILSQDGILESKGENEGVDLYVTTSSAGGGLQMLVTGVIREVTAESAERAALGAGAIVMDVLSIDDKRPVHEKIERMRSLRPDMILVAGGVDGGADTHVMSMVEFITTTDPKARLGVQYKLPIVYAGNKNLRDSVKKTLGDSFALRIVDNVRPTMETENPEPARNAIHELFMEHVMSHAPGYHKLMKWTPVPIMPTPAGEGIMFRTIADAYQENVIGVGLGGATTNIYSVYDGKFVRSVSANLGMSYSVGNVIRLAHIENILRWLPFQIDEVELRHRLYNKMIRPTIIPQTLENLIIEQAVARESIRVAFRHHKLLARPLAGALVAEKGMDRWEQQIGETYIDMMKIGWIGGTGGLLSHAPRRVQSAMIIIDGFQPSGITKLSQDSVFMMPHLGVFSTVHPKAAMEIFEKDCLVRLGTCIAFSGQAEQGKKVASFTVEMPDGSTIAEDILFGTIKIISLHDGKANVEIKPASEFDVGARPGHAMKTSVEGGVVGIILDARGRPLVFPEDENARRNKMQEWLGALDMYPREAGLKS
jgi:uncharacterized protein (TIGR01319 family)